jgi:hypothetical protein
MDRRMFVSFTRGAARLRTASHATHEGTNSILGSSSDQQDNAGMSRTQGKKSSDKNQVKRESVKVCALSRAGDSAPAPHYA